MKNSLATGHHGNHFGTSYCGTRPHCKPGIGSGSCEHGRWLRETAAVQGKRDSFGCVMRLRCEGTGDKVRKDGKVAAKVTTETACGGNGRLAMKGNYQKNSAWNALL